MLGLQSIRIRPDVCTRTWVQKGTDELGYLSKPSNETDICKCKSRYFQMVFLSQHVFALWKGVDMPVAMNVPWWKLGPNSDFIAIFLAGKFGTAIFSHQNPCDLSILEVLRPQKMRQKRVRAKFLWLCFFVVIFAKKSQVMHLLGHDAITLAHFWIK